MNNITIITPVINPQNAKYNPSFAYGLLDETTLKQLVTNILETERWAGLETKERQIENWKGTNLHGILMPETHQGVGIITITGSPFKFGEINKQSPESQALYKNCQKLKSNQIDSIILPGNWENAFTATPLHLTEERHDILTDIHLVKTNPQTKVMWTAIDKETNTTYGTDLIDIRLILKGLASQ